MTYLSDEQVRLLLKPIHPKRVLMRDGMSYVEGYDVKAELNRVFGFGRWSVDILGQDLICETATKTRNNKDAWYVVYKSSLRLTVCAPDGSPVAHYEESHVGESTHPVRGEAHGNALTNSWTYALKRCASNLGDQFGLSLYGKGSMDALVRWTLVRPEQADGASTTDTDDVPQVAAESAEVPGGTGEDNAGSAFDEAEVPEPVLAPRDADEADLADEARAAIAGRSAPAQPPVGDPWSRPWAEYATEQAATFATEEAGTKLWHEAGEKARKREITADDMRRVRELVTARIEDLRKAEAGKILGLLDANDPWRLKAEELADGDHEAARAALEELARAVTAKQVDMTRANRVSRAIAVRFPKAATERQAAA